jgi:ribosomal protein S18 acetylase RimI-like enzyme
MKAELMTKLSQYQEDAVLFGATFRALFKGQAEQVDFSEIAGVEFFHTDNSGLTEKDKQEMLDIHVNNWKDRDAGPHIIEGFQKILAKNKDSIYWVLKKDGQVLAFIRFDQSDKPGHIYAGTFNVHPKYRGSAIGEAMRKNAFEVMAREYIVDATADPSDASNIVSKYIEEDGFIIDGLKPFPGEMKFRLKITCDRKSKVGALTRSMDRDFILRNIDQKDKTGDFIVRAYDEKDTSGVINDIKELTELGYVGTRYFKDAHRKIYVFEKAIKEELLEESKEEFKTAA